MARVFASPHPMTRLGPAAIVMFALLVAALLEVHDARMRRRRRAQDERIRAAAAQAIGPELALHSASRWLRHPTRSEPWAASADAPAMLDVDPAGALAPPPRQVLQAGWAPTRVTVRHR